MEKHYVEFSFPGVFMSESSEQEIPERDVKLVVAPEECFGYRFFSRTETVEGNETLLGKKRDYSGIYYFGELYDAKRVEQEVPDCKILLSNMKCNKWNKVVKTRMGNFQPFEDKDFIIG